MKKTNLIPLGVHELNEVESAAINGGSATSWLKKFGPAGIAFWVIDNWKDIKSGAVSAWNDYDKNQG
ncbi:MAG: hypothetical protein V4541_05485 [Bacteroidota bacterium]